MSYKMRSSRTVPSHDESQWVNRSLEGELESFYGRTLIPFFEKYLKESQLKILEAGCGLGAWCEWFRLKGYDVVGLEYSENIVRKAKTICSDIPVELGDVTAIKYCSNSFDVYVSLGVIEHFEKGPEKALSEAFRVLRPGGLAFFTVPLLSPLRRIISHPIRDLYCWFKGFSNTTMHFWEYRYTRSELRCFVENAGFEILEDGIDDYEQHVSDRHIGLWADWFFLRKSNGKTWELNSTGKCLLRVLKVLPRSWYCSGWLVIARAKK